MTWSPREATEQRTKALAYLLDETDGHYIRSLDWREQDASGVPDPVWSLLHREGLVDGYVIGGASWQLTIDGWIEACLQLRDEIDLDKKFGILSAHLKKLGGRTGEMTTVHDVAETTGLHWLWVSDAISGKVTGAVIEQRLRPLGYNGGHSILQEYLRKIRPQLAPQRAFVRMEPLPGERFEVDWGHFGALRYSGDTRKLYAFALVDAHSRMLYVEFTHSQSFETFARCHIHAFTALGGVARQIAYDNLATAVAEHDGRLVRFLPRFLGFAGEFGFFPLSVDKRP